MPIDPFLLGHEAALRLGSFFFALLVLAAWELLAPRRRLRHSKMVRWSNAAALTAINIVMMRVLFPIAAVAVAAAAEQRGTGLLHMWVVPYPIAVVAALLAFDFAVYLVHLAFHTAPVLWRMHRLHHADRDVDVSTAVRFHPIQALLSTLVKLAVIVVLGAPVLAVVIFETLFHSLLLFNHANVRIPLAADRVLRWFIVTPDMHAVHHSARMRETNSNFGFALPWWDRLLGTYREAPAEGVEHVTLGIGHFGAPEDCRLDRMLLNPLLGNDVAISPRHSARRRRQYQVRQAR